MMRRKMCPMDYFLQSIEDDYSHKGELKIVLIWLGMLLLAFLGALLG